MLNRQRIIQKSQALLITAQGLHWSKQRLIALASQLITLVFCMFVLTAVLINIGERQLQREWANKRYSELQVLGSVFTNTSSTYQYRTNLFSDAEIIKQFIEEKSEPSLTKLNHTWAKIVSNFNEIIGISLFSQNGDFIFKTGFAIEQLTLPPHLINKKMNSVGISRYTSPIELFPIDGRLEPVMYDIAVIKNKQDQFQGYFVNYFSVNKILEDINPALPNKASAVMLFNAEGALYANRLSINTQGKLPQQLGTNLKQINPQLWRKMKRSSYGQMHGQHATYIYIKIKLNEDSLNSSDYYLLSYVPNSVISDYFSFWRYLLIVFSFMATLMGIVLLLLCHLYRLQQRSREKSLYLANNLFDRNLPSLLLNEDFRVLSANKAALSLFNTSLESLLERKFQTSLQLDDAIYADIMSQISNNHHWQGLIDLSLYGGKKLQADLKRAETYVEQPYYILSLTDISEQSVIQYQAYLSEILNDCAVATLIIQPDGKIIKTNPKFDELLNSGSNTMISSILQLNDDIGSTWPRICEQVIMKGTWQGQLFSNLHTNNSLCLHMTLKAINNSENEISYMIATLETIIQQPTLFDRHAVIPHRTSILLNVRELEYYFESYNQVQKQNCSLMIIDISPEGMLSHISDVEQLENHQLKVEMQILRELPKHYQMCHYKLGKIILLLPETNGNQAYLFASTNVEQLKNNGLGEGIHIGITSYNHQQTFTQLIDNAEVALKRALHSNSLSIGQAFTHNFITK